MKKTIYLIIVAAAFAGCRKSEFEPVERTNGEADFTRYVAVGNSLTQGFQDGGVYEEGQRNSYPAIIAGQMKLVEPDMGEFRQPDVYGNGSGYMHLAWVNGEIEVVSAGDPGGYDADPSWDGWQPQGIKYNNLGISGITLVQTVALDDGQAAINNGILGGVSFEPFFSFPGNPFARFLDFGDNPAPLLGGGQDVEYLDHIKQSGATFFTCWLGNNDVLGYATAGGVTTSIDLSLAGLGTLELGALSDPVEFRQKYDSVMYAFNSIGAKGVVATLPDVTVIPYLNTFTVEGVKEDMGYTDLWIETGTGTIRPATSADLILLTAADTIESGMGSTESWYLTNDYILDQEEVSTVQARTVELNAAIYASAGQFGFGVVDMYTFLNDMKPGITYEGIGFTPSYIEGGAFSLDGIHLNPRGYAIVANEFIKVINDTYGSNIPKVSVGNYRGVIFP